MPAREITYELKLKNIKHLIYGEQNNIELDYCACGILRT